MSRTISGLNAIIIENINVTTTISGPTAVELTLTKGIGNSFNVLSTSPAVSTTDAASVFYGGVGIVKNLIIGETLKINSATASNSKITGALVVTGGIGTSGAMNAALVRVQNSLLTSNGDDLFINANNSTVYVRTLNDDSQGRLELTNTDFKYLNNAGTTIFSIVKSTGVASVVKLTSSDTTASSSSTVGANLFAGGISISNTTDATSTTNGGTFTTPGGAAIAKKLYVGDTAFLNKVSVTDTTISTSKTTGAQIIAGGLGVNGALYANSINSTTSVTCTSLALTGNTGSFTPIIASNVTVTYTIQSGTYYTIGNLIYITIRLDTTSDIFSTPGELLRVYNLPFNASHTQTLTPPFLSGYALPTSTDYVTTQINSGEAQVYFQAIRDNLSTSLVMSPTTAANRVIFLSAMYQWA